MVSVPSVLKMKKLAINGGTPVRRRPFPKWPIYDRLEQSAIQEVLKSRRWGCLDGNKVSEFENKFAKYQGAKFGICTVNGTASLRVALQALNVGAVDEVIIPAYTFVATASAILDVNAIPVFVDINENTYNIEPDKIEEAITERTKAIIPVHFAGMPSDMDRIMEIATKHNLFIIEDAAQAHGAEWKGRKVGAIGDIGCFSFQSSKNVTCGEGGILLCDDEELAKRCRAIVNHGRREHAPWYMHYELGSNYRMTEFQAAILIAQLTRLDEQNKTRNDNGKYLTERLNKIEGIEPLNRDEHVTVHAYHLYIFKYDKKLFANASREQFVKALNAEGIPATTGYAMPLYRQPAFETISFGKYNYSSLHLPVSEAACKQSVWLPQNLLLGSKADMDDIVEAIEKIKLNAKEL